MEPTKGDFINELQIIRAMKTFATVTTDPMEKADVYYTRGCQKLFLTLPRPKVYVASPYNKTCYDAADAIATLSTEWTRRLLTGTHEPLNGEPVTKPVITIQQVLPPEFRPLQDHPKTKQIRKELGGGFIIGQFGKMRPTNYPHSFLKLLPKIKKEHPEINVVFSDTCGISSKEIKQQHFPYKMMPHVLSACDLLLFPYWCAAGHFSGALRVKEAMACGVPIVSAKFKAREEELGEGYEFFHPVVEDKQHKAESVLHGLHNAITKAIEDTELRAKVGKRLAKRAEFYSIANSAKRMKADFESLCRS